MALASKVCKMGISQHAKSNGDGGEGMGYISTDLLIHFTMHALIPELPSNQVWELPKIAWKFHLHCYICLSNNPEIVLDYFLAYVTCIAAVIVMVKSECLLLS